MNILEKILEEIDRLDGPYFVGYIDRYKVKEIIRSHMYERERVTSAEIIFRNIDGKPYYEIKYKKVGEDNYTVGYSSYYLEFVVGWLNEYFEFCGEAKVVVNDAEDANAHSNDDWIPVEDGLPKVNERVLVTVKHSCWISDFNSNWVPEEKKIKYPETNGTYIGCINENGIWIFIDEEGQDNICDKEFGLDLGKVYDVVTHWQPLPKPYKPKKDVSAGKHIMSRFMKVE